MVHKSPSQVEFVPEVWGVARGDFKLKYDEILVGIVYVDVCSYALISII